MATDKPKSKKANQDATNKTVKKKVVKKAKVTKKSSPIKARAKAANSNSSKRGKQITPEERLEMVRTAAYYLAEKRGYHGNNELGDWLEAEREIDSISP